MSQITDHLRIDLWTALESLAQMARDVDELGGVLLLEIQDHVMILVVYPAELKAYCGFVF